MNYPVRGGGFAAVPVRDRIDPIELNLWKSEAGDDGVGDPSD